MKEARPQIPTPMRPQRIVGGKGSMLCGGAKYLESTMWLLVWRASFGAAISTAECVAALSLVRSGF
jgi:hypothetical protein